MRTVWGNPPWEVTAPSAAAPLPATVDVAVVGAGFTGLTTAYEAARRGLRVAVLEAGQVGAGASGRTGGIALEGTAVGLLPGTEDCLGSLARVTDRADIACALDLRGCWEITHLPDPGRHPLFRDGEAMLTVAQTVPGGTLDPGALLSGLARAARAAGATLHERHAAERIEPGAAPRVHTARGVLAAGRVVVALNGFTPTLLPGSADFHPALTLALATAPLDPDAIAAVGLGERLPFYTEDLPYLWGRLLPDGRLVVGSGLVFPDGGTDVRAARVDSPDASAAFTRLETRLRGFHPSLAAIAIERRWGGPIAFVPNRTPVLSQLPDAPEVVVTGGYAGHGVALSIRIGELIADHLAAGTPLPSWGALAERVPA